LLIKLALLRRPGKRMNLVVTFGEIIVTRMSELVCQLQFFLTVPYHIF